MVTCWTGRRTSTTPRCSRTPAASKPKFALGFETSDPKCKTRDAAGTTSTYKNCDRTLNSADYGSSWPHWAAHLDLPDNSDQFKNFPGCQYSGATRIKFITDGTMKVWSKESTATLTVAACGTPAALASAAGATVNVPTDQVIYVRGGTPGTHQCPSGRSVTACRSAQLPSRQPARPPTPTTST